MLMTQTGVVISLGTVKCTFLVRYTLIITNIKAECAFHCAFHYLKQRFTSMDKNI